MGEGARSAPLTLSIIMMKDEEADWGGGRGSIFEIQTDGTDHILGVPIRHGMGFGLRSDLMPISPNKKACFWGGWGGSLSVIDVDANMSFAYVMNRMAPSLQHDMRAGRLLMATHAAIS